MIKKPKNLKRRFIQAILLFILIAIGAWWLWHHYAPLTVRVVSPERGLAVEAVYATGLVEAQQTAKISPVTGGQVMQILSEVGDVVEPGQVLAIMNDRQAQQQFMDAQAAYNLAVQEENRVNALLSKGFTTPQIAERALAERQQAQAIFELQRSRLADVKITAPVKGLISARDVSVGQNVTANSILFTIVSSDQKRIVADIDERDISKLAVNSRLLAKAEAFPGQVFEAAITKIYQTANNTNRTYRVEANLPSTTPLLIGMTLDVNVILEERPSALLLPTAAIHFEQAGVNLPPLIYVWQVKNGQAQRIPLEIGVQGLQKTEIKTPLNITDQIIISPPDQLRPGRSVDVIP